MPRNERLSRALTKTLRHAAKKQGFHIDSEGYIEINELLASRLYSDFTKEDILNEVQSNAKQRFSITTKHEKQYIKANQGHSIIVEDLSLKPITISDIHLYPCIVHGTYFAVLQSIIKDGLCRMNRNHIHFAKGVIGEGTVISGARWSCEIYIEIDLEKALQDGYKFFESENEVILCPGGSNGYLPSLYFKKIFKSKDKSLIEFTPK